MKKILLSLFWIVSCCLNYQNAFSQVTLYVDENYSGKSMVVGVGEHSCMDLGNGILNKWGITGDAVKNDQVTSLRISPGYKITVWWDCGFTGESRVFTSDCPNVGPHWNDQISSYKVEYVGSPQPPNSGSITFKNNTGQDLYYFYVISGPNAIFDVCASRKGGTLVRSGDSYPVTFNAGGILNYYFYTERDICDGRYEKAHGAIVSQNARGGVITIQ